jgi:hypothetical protein
MKPTHGEYDRESVDGMDELKDRLANADNDRDLSFILSDYISWGNNKVSKKTAIFNMNSATDCPHAETERCQVDFGDCYAHKAENMYKNTLPYRRRQEHLWDALSAEEWAGAFKCLVSRKRNPVECIRFSEAGDFRNQSDIRKVNDIARYMAPDGIDVYTYSASVNLDWSEASWFTVNASNSEHEYGDRHFNARPEGAELPDGEVWCPYSLQQNDGVPAEERRKCGEGCKLCINEDGPDVSVQLH